MKKIKIVICENNKGSARALSLYEETEVFNSYDSSSAIKNINELAELPNSEIDLLFAHISDQIDEDGNANFEPIAKINSANPNIPIILYSAGFVVEKETTSEGIHFELDGRSKYLNTVFPYSIVISSRPLHSSSIKLFDIPKALSEFIKSERNKKDISTFLAAIQGFDPILEAKLEILHSLLESKRQVELPQETTRI